LAGDFGMAVIIQSDLESWSMNLPDHFIVGLGNPGHGYAKSRHNAGFMVADRLVSYQQAGSRPVVNQDVWEELSAFGVHRADVVVDTKAIQVQVLKPQRFMNQSGPTLVGYWSYYWKQIWQNERASLTDRLWVIHDDLDIPIGQFKIQFGTGPKVHNGLLSLYQALGTNQFWHVRVGVDGRQGGRQQAGQEYVLGSFSSEERELMDETIDGLLITLQTQLLKD